MANGAYRVLYIDDQPDAIDLVRLTLQRIGCDVIGATDGEQGIEMMRHEPPDLVLLDLMLPGWDGWQVREAMQADSELRRLPVVLVTARVAMSSHAPGRQPPTADAYITKPFSLGEMRETIGKLLRRAQPAAQAA